MNISSNSSFDAKKPLGQFDPGLKEVHIFGAGISGLVMGHFLLQKGFDVWIFEKSERAGGKIQTLSSPYGPIEWAANSVLTSDGVWDLLDQLNLNDEIIYPAKKLSRKIAGFEIPKDQSSTTSKLVIKKSPFLSLGQICHVLGKIFTTPPFKSVNELKKLTLKEFLSPLLSEKVVDDVVSSALGGIYALGANDLHAASIFDFSELLKKIENNKKFSYRNFIAGVLANSKRNNQKYRRKVVSISFKKGMGTLTEALYHRLKDRIIFNWEDQLELNVDVKKRFKQKSNIILTAPAGQGQELINKYFPQYSFLSDELKKIEYSPIQTSTYFINEQIPQLNSSYGILFQQQNTPQVDTPFKNLGVLANSNIFENRIFPRPERKFLDKNKIDKNNVLQSLTFISSSATGDSDPEEFIKNDFQLLGFNEEKITVAKFFDSYKIGIPRYDLKRFEALNNISQKLFAYHQPGLVLFGNYTNGLAIREIISKAQQFCEIWAEGTNFNESSSRDSH
jgi:protoporphyrinogen oxidase